MPRRDGVADRRSVQRYEALGSLSMVWVQDENGHREIAQLLDISQEGARLEAAEAPPKGATVWLLFRPRQSELWLSGMVVDSRRGWKRRSTIRVRFQDLCPYDVLRDAIRGMNMPDTDLRSDREEFRDKHLWR